MSKVFSSVLHGAAPDICHDGVGVLVVRHDSVKDSFDLGDVDLHNDGRVLGPEVEVNGLLGGEGDVHLGGLKAAFAADVAGGAAAVAVYATAGVADHLCFLRVGLGQDNFISPDDQVVSVDLLVAGGAAEGCATGVDGAAPSRLEVAKVGLGHTVDVGIIDEELRRADL